LILNEERQKNLFDEKINQIQDEEIKLIERLKVSSEMLPSENTPSKISINKNKTGSSSKKCTLGSSGKK
jgi:hypothetical protein